jgi:hypothetical protein
MQNRAGRLVIDFAGMTADAALDLSPASYQKLMTEVKPLRDPNPRDSIREIWWRFAWERPELRKAIKDLGQYFVTLETAKHRYFVSIPETSLWDGSLFAIATNDWYIGGILSSNIHCTWSHVNGGRLGPTPRYNRARCFETFPFPALEDGDLKQRIRELGERLDAHRKRQQELHPSLTLTGMYNVLEKVRANEPLTAKEKTIHDQGLITLLLQLHDELDAAVLEAYGWSDLHPINASNEAELLTRLVALNHTRAAEEKSGLIRWLRPEYQNPTQQQPIQANLAGTETSSLKSKIQNQQSSIVNQSWPEKLPEQVTLIRQLLTTNPTTTPEEISNHFGRKNQKRVEQIEGIIQTLRGLGTI